MVLFCVDFEFGKDYFFMVCINLILKVKKIYDLYWKYEDFFFVLVYSGVKEKDKIVERIK